MDERMAFIVDCRRKELDMAELCRRYGISRKTGYKWFERYEASGLEGLNDCSRAPHHHPNAVSTAIAAEILKLKRRYPSWGSKKIHGWLTANRGGMDWPVRSTVSEILDRHGLVKHRRRRHHAPPPTSLRACERANEVWGADFKGWFWTGDGKRCDPFSLSDLGTRYVLRLQVLPKLDGEHVWPLFDAAFREFGRPLAVRSDNGPPFASTGAGGLSWLAVQLVKAGIEPERIAPGKPQQNGRHERLHLTLKQDTASPPAKSLRQQQRRFDDFRRIFNEERPHEALKLTPPAVHYAPSPRSWSGRLEAPDYPADHQVRRVRRNGEIKWDGELIFLSEALIGEPVGIVEIDDGRWQVNFGPVELGTIDAAGQFFRRRAGACPRPAPQPQPPG